MKTRIPFLAVLALGPLLPGAELPAQLEGESTVAFAGAGRVEQPAVPPRELSANVSEVVRLAGAGIEESVILAFVKAARAPFDLAADEVIYLKDIGIPPEIVSAMLHQDTVLRETQLQTGAAAVTLPPTVPTNAAPIVPPVYVTNAPPQVTYFYDSLAPYGTWIEIEGLGWCWQPRAVAMDREWRPYWQGGRWIYTDSDWYWYSDYSWGWAPFHYGRWHRHAHWGWLWFPDLVWAPAWVCWRYSDTYCGWAPLPLGAHFVAGRGLNFNGVSVGVDFDFHLGFDFFTFVEIGHFHERNPHLHGVPHARVADVYRNTTVINKYAVGRNNRVINRGVPVGRVAVAGRREIHPVEIRENRLTTDGRAGRERLETSGKTPVLYRSALQAPLQPPQVSAQRVDAQRPIVPQPARPPSVGGRAGEGRSTITRPATPAPRAPGRPPTLPPTTQPRTQPPAPGSPQPAPARPGPPSRVAPGRTFPPATPVRPFVPPSRAESPKGREQRTSNGRSTERVAPRVSTPPRAPGGSGRGDDGKPRR